ALNAAGKVLAANERVQLVTYDDAVSALFSLLSGEIEALAYPEPVMWKLAEKVGVARRIKAFGPPLVEIKRAVAVRKGNTELLKRLDAAVTKFKGTEDYRRIYRKWYGEPEPFWASTRFKLVVGAFSFMIVLFVVVWRYIWIVTLNRKLNDTITELQEAKNALQKSEASLADAQRLAHLGSWEWDIVNRRIYWSEETYRIFGMEPQYPPEGEGEEIFLDAVHTDDRAHVERCIHRALYENARYILDFRIVRSDGAECMVHAQGLATFNDDGSPSKVAGIVQDITTRKKIESKLQRAHQRLESIINLNPTVIYSLQPTGQEPSPFRAAMISDTIEQVAGYKVSDWLNNPTFWMDHLHPQDRAQALRRQDELLQNGELHHEYRFRHKDGSYRWIHDKLVLLRDEQGEIKDIIGSWMDITKRIAAEEAVRKERDRAQRYLDIAEVMLLALDDQGRIQMINREGYKILGYAAGELNGRNWFDMCLPPAKVDAAKEFFQRLMAGERKYSKHAEEYVLTKTGEQKLISWHNALLTNEAGRVVGTLSSGSDITGHKQAEIELKHAIKAAEGASRAKSEFLANVSHELRTPLNGVLGYAQILQMSQAMPEDLRESVNVIRQSGDYLLTLINDILDLSKIEADKLELEKNVFNFGEFLRGIADMFYLRAEEKGVPFQFKQLSNLPAGVRGDEKRLRQVLINLLSNAVKFTDKGHVWLMVQHKGDTAYFVVEDTGYGIDEENLEKIFEPFQRVGHSNKGREGTGLGLAICRKLIDAMDGQLHVTSKSGQGSRFCVTVKLPSGPVSAPGSKPEKWVQGYEGRRREILIVDDNLENLSMLRNMLSILGFGAGTAVSGKDCLEKLKHARPDAVFMDLIMPGMDGIETTRRLRQMDAGKDVVVVVVSANAFPEDRVKSIAAGCNDFLAKPIDMDKLLECLQRHLSLVWIYKEDERVEETQQVSLDGVSLLIADDNKINRILLRTQLAKTGVRVTEATEGNDALALMELQPFDLILLDIQMPNKNGIEIIESIKARQTPNSQTPVIAITAYAEKTESLFAAGFCDILIKPVFQEQLIGVVKRWLLRRRLGDCPRTD
ncbi:MAG: response regulator, partial [Pseudomonadota bacterium]